MVITASALGNHPNSRNAKSREENKWIGGRGTRHDSPVVVATVHGPLYGLRMVADSPLALLFRFITLSSSIVDHSTYSGTSMLGVFGPQLW